LFVGGQRGVGAYDPGVEPTYRLTPRQKQVLELVARGLGGKGIATQLGISHQTVRNHLVSIHGALGAVSSSHAVAIAIERKLIDHCQDDEPVTQHRTEVVAVVFLICQEVAGDV